LWEWTRRVIIKLDWFVTSAEVKDSWKFKVLFGEEREREKVTPLENIPTAFY
jgi:hypothetical protein